MRVLAEQTVARLRLSEEIAVTELLGGAPREIRSDWMLRPERRQILVGTVEILISRALNRGPPMGERRGR